MKYYYIIPIAVFAPILFLIFLFYLLGYGLIYFAFSNSFLMGYGIFEILCVIGLARSGILYLKSKGNIERARFAKRMLISSIEGMIAGLICLIVIEVIAMAGPCCLE
jgi:hypothetical protein